MCLMERLFLRGLCAASSSFRNRHFTLDSASASKGAGAATSFTEGAYSDFIVAV
jgi:hypothetical protein